MDFNGTDVVIFSDPIFNERHVRFTTLLFQTLSNQTCVRYCFNIHTPDSSRFPINISQSTKKKIVQKINKESDNLFKLLPKIAKQISIFIQKNKDISIKWEKLLFYGYRCKTGMHSLVT